jgi:hypothetical protein
MSIKAQKRCSEGLGEEIIADVLSDTSTKGSDNSPQTSGSVVTDEKDPSTWSNRWHGIVINYSQSYKIDSVSHIPCGVIQVIEIQESIN